MALLFNAPRFHVDIKTSHTTSCTRMGAKYWGIIWDVKPH